MLPMPARSDRVGPVNPNMTSKRVISATAITNSAAARTAPGRARGNTDSSLYDVSEEQPQGRTQFHCDQRELGGRRVKFPQREFLQLLPVGADVLLLRGNACARVVNAYLENQRAVERQDYVVAVFA